MLGAMAAVQPTFKASVESCVSQIVGVLFGAAVGVLLRLVAMPPLVATGIGMVLVITLLCVVMIGGNVWASCVEHRRVDRINRAKEERRLQERERILKEKQKNSPPPQQQNFHAQ